MDQRENKARFSEADRLYRQGRYRDALAILVDLDRRYPNTKNILFPMARCLERLDFDGEAESICDRLIGEYNLERARRLREKLDRKRVARTADDASQGTATGVESSDLRIPDLGLNDSLVGRPAPLKPDPPWLSFLKSAAIPAVVVLGLAIVVVFILFVLPRIDMPVEDEVSDAAKGELTARDLVLILLAMEVASTLIAVTIVILLRGELPRPTLGQNIVQVLVGSVAAVVASFLGGLLHPFAGRVAWFMALTAFFQTTFWQVLLIYGIRTVLMVAGVLFGFFKLSGLV